MAFLLQSPQNGGVIFRLFQPGDFAQLYAIEEVCFQPPLRFGRRYMKQLIDSADSVTWVAEENNALAGFSIVDWTREADGMIAYIPTLEVLPEQRRRGIGLALLQALETSALQAGASLIWLHVDAENAPAIELYRSRGYRHLGRREHYYAMHRAADIYSKELAIARDRARL